ncbi:hypothetical protein FPV67DRAFT_1019856 [Lyophyllum atratum]|nr:hypothetical protein FPV67DRAFT_1019856 [Lyophyllum atratum]
MALGPEMEPLRKLRDLIAEVDYNRFTKKDHRKIYEYLEREVLSPKSRIIKQVPTLDFIVYSIHKIIYPKLATRRIPDLLDLLATVEFYRKRTLDLAQEALVWNEYYKTEKTVVTLPAGEEELLNELEEKQDSMRIMYTMILTTCCQLDMYLMWTATPPSMTDFLIRFNEYFPSLNGRCDRDSPRLFYADLSDNETAQIKEVGLEYCGFTQQTIEWATKYAGERESMHDAFCTEDFKNTFPWKHQEKDLSRLIGCYLLYVTSAANGVEDMFPGHS